MAGVLTVPGPDRGPAAEPTGPATGPATGPDRGPFAGPSTGPAPSRIAVVGGGPGGLYAAALLKRLDPRREVTVWERNAPSDTFGFGVVLSDETLGGIRDADPVVYEALRRDLVRWDDIDVVHRGHRTTSTGHGFAALGRRRLLEILHARCTELGVRLRFRAEAPPPDVLAAGHDLVVAADGVHSRTREAHAAHFRPRITTHRCRYIWLAADFAFDAFRFETAETEYGVMQLHAYPYEAGASTAIVEMREEVWRAAGFEELDEAESTVRCAKIFAEALGGRELRSHRSAWTAFRTVVNAHWSYGNTVLIGDAAHTAHFSIGSGTKLAVEDALALANSLEGHTAADGGNRTLPEALAAYEAERRPVVESTQRAATASLRWFEELAGHVDRPPRRFAFDLLTRSRRVTHANLRLRDPAFTATVERDFGCPPGTPPMFTPFRLRGLTLRNRVVVSPMDMYVAEDGVPGDFHLVHLGSRALGGAGLVMTEMVCVSPEGRITPAAPACGPTNRPPPGPGSPPSRTPRHPVRRSVSSSATPAARAPPDACGRASTSRCPRTTGRSSPPRPSRTGPASTRRPEPSTAQDSAPCARSSRPPPGAPPAPASTSSNCTAPTAICSPASSPRSPTTAPTRTGETSTADCASRSRSSTRYGRCGPRSAP